VLYRRLSVFAGGWTLPAVEQVCADEALPTAEVLDGLTLLVEKSLVVMTPDWGADGARYRLLETMRQHAAARLLAAEGAADALRLRHAAWCRALAEALFPQVCAPGPGAALARLDQEQANLLAALAWCARDPGPALARAAAEAGLRVGFALRPYWLMRGRPSLGVETALAVLAQPGAQPRDALRAQGLLNAGQLSSFMGRYADVQTYLGESLAIAHEIGDQLGATAALQPLGMAALGLGDAAAARRHFEAAVAAARALHSAKQLASGLNALAQLERLEGRLEAAQALYTEAMVLARQLGDLQYIGSLLLNLAMVALGRGRSDGVANGLREVLRIADDTGSRPAALSALDVCAGLAAQRGEAARAARFFGLAEAQAVAAGLQRDAADAAFLMPLIAQARQALGEHGFAAAEQAGRASTLEAMAAEAEAWLADPQPAAASTPLPAA
jgi:non-specific serine/threonine protein kinase